VRLFAFLADDGPTAGLLSIDDRVVRLAAADGGLDLALAEGRFGEILSEAVSAEAGSGADVGSRRSELEPLPALEYPGKIVCVGLNYRDHIAEQHLELPARPMLFAKFGNAIIGDGEAIVRPEGTTALDLEVELAAPALPLQALRDHLVLAREQLHVAVHAKATLAQPLQPVPVRSERDSVGDAHLVAPDRQRPLSRERGIELRDGMTIGIGGWGSRRKPMALVRGERPALLLEADATDPAATGNAIAAVNRLAQTVLATRSGIAPIVRRLWVMSSPTSPFPRVAPRSSTPSR